MAEKLYYSMGEVAEMLCVSQSLVRFWEKRFDILTPHKNKKGNRLFSPDDVRNLKTIYHLVKEKGMTLAGAEKQLKARRSAIERDMEIAERLGAIRALLVEVRNELGGGGIIVDSAESDFELGIRNYESGGRDGEVAGGVGTFDPAAPIDATAEVSETTATHETAEVHEIAEVHGIAEVPVAERNYVEQTLF
jgi:DNA-binding transcriptional MerR regulator